MKDFCSVCGLDYDSMTSAERAKHGVAGEFIVETCEEYAARAARVDACLVEARAAVDASHEAEDADAGFDGGEFSGPAHARMLARTLERIGAKYGFSLEQVEDIMAAADYADAHEGQEADA